MNCCKPGLGSVILCVGLMGMRTAQPETPSQAEPPAMAMSAAQVMQPAQAPAPLGAFGADMPAQGHFVVAVSGSDTRLRDNYIGAHSVSAPYIVTNVVSPDTPGGAHVLRLAPTHVTFEGASASIFYGLSNDLSLFASTGWIHKDVQLQTFKGLSGTTTLGYSDGVTSGLGDTTVAAIGRIYHDAVNRVNLNLGLGLPTGSTTETMTILVPDGTQATKRAFYAMQPGTGTVDLLPGVTYSGVKDRWAWGASYRARLPLDHSAQGWAYGDLHEINTWTAYSWLPTLETTLRLNATTQGAIHGQDPTIRGYAESSNPQNYGGQQVSVYVGAMAGAHFSGLPPVQFGIEGGIPVYQDLNGPQPGRDWQINVVLRCKL